MSTNNAAEMLPSAIPDCANRRLLLFALRRIAAGGLHDAHAALLMVDFFGQSFRRPLLLLRAFMAESSRVASRRLLVAPCCCGRATEHEQVLLDVVTSAPENPQGAHEALRELLGVRHCLGALSSAQALGQAFADYGRALSWE